MKTKMIQTETSQHVVAIENGTELRAYFVDSSLHTAAEVARILRHDAARFNCDIGEQANFAALPVINVRTAKSGRPVYSIAQ